MKRTPKKPGAQPHLQVHPIRGRRPSLMNCTIGELQVDPAYQRGTDNGTSRALIRKIAREWDWSLFQLLVVSRRPDGGLYVVDGQHRWEAARLRRDLYDLPCSVYDFPSVAEEAAAFVALNQQRKPLGALDLFRAAVEGGGDAGAIEVMRLITQAGLSLAGHTNFTAWKPGQISNISGIRKAHKMHGPDVTGRALRLLASAFEGEVLRYGGTLFPGIVTTIAELKLPRDADELLEVSLSGLSQAEWAEEIAHVAARHAIHRTRAAARALTEIYLEAAGEEQEVQAA